MRNPLVAILAIGAGVILFLGIKGAYSSTHAVLQSPPPTQPQASTEPTQPGAPQPTHLAIPDKPVDLSLWDGARQITITFDEDGQTQITGLVCKNKKWGKVNLTTTRDVWRHAAGQQVENEITGRWLPKP